MNTGQRVNEALIAAVLIVGVIAFFMSPLPGIILAYLRAIVGRYVTTAAHISPPAPAPQVGPAAGVSPRNETPETAETRVATGEIERNTLLRAKAEALAALVAAGKVGETDGLRLVFGVSPGSSAAYREAQAALKAALAAIPQFPELQKDGRPVAARLRAKAR